MKKTFLGFLIVFQLFFVNAFAQTFSKEALAQRVIELSGVDVLLKTLPRQVTELIRQEGVFSNNPEAMDQAAKISSELFDFKLASKIILQHVNEQMTVEELGKVLNWMETPLGGRITKAEIDATTLEGEKKIDVYINNFKLPTEDRIQLMLKFEKEVDLTEETLLVLKTMYLAMFENSGAFTSNEENTTPQVASEVWKDMEPEVRKLTKEYIILSDYYIYRDFSNEEMERYITYSKSKWGRKFVAIAIGGIIEVLDEYSRVYFKRVFQMFESQENTEKPVQITQ